MFGQADFVQVCAFDDFVMPDRTLVGVSTEEMETTHNTHTPRGSICWCTNVEACRKRFPTTDNETHLQSPRLTPSPHAPGPPAFPAFLLDILCESP